MLRLVCILLLLLGLAPVVVATSWPALPKAGFVSGRAATAEDVNAGRAGFVLKDGDAQIGRPLSIAIPQYANFKDEGKLVPVVIIQAETARGQSVVAARTLKGEIVVGLLTDFDLLGKSVPRR